MSLVADYSSDESSDHEDLISKKYSVLKKKTEINQLPSANSLLTGNPGEVFNNVYKKAEELKIASLEKHCKMVDTEEHIKEKNGKKICWNYRKGRCRFGSNCTFAHDSDLHSTINNSKEQISLKQDIPNIASISRNQNINNKKPFNQEISGSGITTLKRNRFAQNDPSIIPNKKVMKGFSTKHQDQFKQKS